MSVKCTLQHLLVFLFLRKVNFLDIREHTFNVTYEKRIVGNSTNISIQTAPSRFHCAIQCASQHACCSASFDKNKRSCSLNSQCYPEVEHYSDSMMMKKISPNGKILNLH